MSFSYARRDVRVMTRSPWRIRPSIVVPPRDRREAAASGERAAIDRRTEFDLREGFGEPRNATRRGRNVASLSAATPWPLRHAGTRQTRDRRGSGPGGRALVPRAATLRRTTPPPGGHGRWKRATPPAMTGRRCCRSRHAATLEAATRGASTWDVPRTCQREQECARR